MIRHIHRFLRERREQILRVWEELVLAEVRRVELAGLALRDTIPQFLDELADWLESGGPPVARKVGAEALKHVLDRLEHGLDLGQVFREYRLLRQALLLVVLEAEGQEQARSHPGERGMPGRVVELARLNLGLDVALSDSIEQFVAERERRAAVAREERDKALRDTNERLREADTRKTEFLAVLSHELRNPLAPIRNSIALLRHAGPLGPQVQRAVEVIDRQTSQLSKLVDELLDIARITSGKVRLHKQVVPLAEVIGSTVEDHRELFDKNEVALRYQDDAPSLLVEVDPARIAQVVANLLQNAVKFTPTGGHVSVALGKTEGRATVRVTDDGTGMDEAMLARLFEAFAQADTTLDRSQGGLGLGLALVRSLVELHGGDVRATSPGLGKGSEFQVSFPLVDKPSASTAAESSSAPRVQRRVVVIEDNVDGAATLRDLLELEGHQVVVAHDGQQGLEAALAGDPDVVLCDLGVPSIDGYEIARRLRARGYRARLVALTGYAAPEGAERARKAGFDDHLPKPPDLEKVFATVLLGKPSV